jgi:two-component system invasion response regulator UvrY
MSLHVTETKGNSRNVNDHVMEKKNIVLVDDHVIIRNGLKELIEKLGPYEISGQYDNGRELVDAFPMKPLPDLIIMDVTMPEMDGDEAMNMLNEKNCQVPVLILTLSHDEARMVRLFRSGVRGYLQKNCSATTMAHALTEILRTGYYHNEFLATSLKTTAVANEDPGEKIILQLTDREREFLKLVCHEKEYTYDQIAGMMGVQHRTVDKYRETLFDKFDIKSKTGLVLFVLKHKLFERL